MGKKITYLDFSENVIKMFDTDNYSENEVINSIIGTWCMNSWSSGVEGAIRRKFEKAKREGKKEITIDIDEAENMILMNDRMQQIFSLLWNYWYDNAQQPSG